MVKGYSIDFLENTYQTRKNPNAKFMLPQEILVEQEINDLLEMGAIQKAIYQKNQFVSHLFLVSKKSWRSEVSYKSEGVKPTHPLPSLQNRGIVSIEENFRKGRLSSQATPQRFLFLCTLVRGLQKIFEDQMERHTLRVFLPLFRTDPSTKTFHKTFESPSNYSQETQYQGKSLHIIILELKAAKFPTLASCKGKNNLAVQLQMDNQIALACLIKMEQG